MADRGNEGKRKWVLIVAVAEYEDADKSLSGETARYLPGVNYDAQLFADVLKHSADAPPGGLDIRRLPTPTRKPTWENIRIEIDRIAERAVSDDQFVFYFGGHGHSAPGGDCPQEDGHTRYLLPYEATMRTAPERGISVRKLLSELARIPCEEFIIILDCCWSARMGRLFTSFPEMQDRRYFVIASAERESLEINGERGLFMVPFCQALEGIGVPLSPDGRVSLWAAFEYVAKAAAQEASAVSRGFGPLVYQEAQAFTSGGLFFLTRPQPLERPPPLMMPLREIELHRPSKQAFLIALVHRVRSTLTPVGKRLELDVRDDTDAIYSPEGKTALYEKLRDESRAPVEAWERAMDLGPAEYYSDRLPLRWASGGALPVLCHRGYQYFVLFFRDAYPQGWNIANGASDNWDEMYELHQLVEREFREELLIHNLAKGVVYYFEDREHRYHPHAHQRKALSLWGLNRCERKALPCDFHPGPDEVLVRMFREGALEIAKRSEGFYISVNAGELGIECIQVVTIQVPPDIDLRDLVLLDGELHPRQAGLLRRPVGLLEVEECRRWLAAGQRHDLRFGHVYEGLRELPNGLYDSKRIREQWAYRNTLCAVTAKTIRRYLAEVNPSP